MKLQFFSREKNVVKMMFTSLCILIYIKNMNNKYSKILNFINSKKNLMHTNAMHE